MADLNEGRIDLPRSRARLIAFAVTAAVLFAALGGRLFQMQILNGSLYADRAVAARTIEVPIKAPRGLIFDRTGRPVAVNVPSWTVDAVPAGTALGSANTQQYGFQFGFNADPAVLGPFTAHTAIDAPFGLR